MSVTTDHDWLRDVGVWVRRLAASDEPGRITARAVLGGIVAHRPPRNVELQTLAVITGIKTADLWAWAIKEMEGK